jgi:capsular polysaccharide biosynthesis protein
LQVWKKALWVALASAFVAAVVYAESALQTPTYEASALLKVGHKEQSDGKIHPIPNAPLGVFAQTVAMDVEPPLVTEETIRRLGLGASLSPGELLDNLTVEQVDSSRFIRLTYTGTDPLRAAQVANTFGKVSSERVSVGSEEDTMTPTLYDKASVPYTPASPKPRRDTLIAFVAGLAISSAVLFAFRRGWLRLVWPG